MVYQTMGFRGYNIFHVTIHGSVFASGGMPNTQTFQTYPTH